VQECVTPVVTVRSAEAETVSITSIEWVGMRFRVAVEGAISGIRIDLRTRAAAADSSKLDSPVDVDAEGKASAPVPDPDTAGDAALVVVLGPAGDIRAQRATTIGGD
jgi:hypothetical protein